MDELHLAQTGAVGAHPLGTPPHNIHFVLVSAQLLGDKATVLAAADKLDGWIGNDVAAAIPIAQPIKAAAPYLPGRRPGRADKRRVALPQPAGAPPYVEAMWALCGAASALPRRAMPRARATSRQERGASKKTGDWSAMDQFAIRRDILRVAQNVVLARAAQAKGDPA